MEYQMKLHQDKSLFIDLISRVSASPSQGGLGIPPQFVEKDYWITNALRNLALSPYSETAVFKGGTSLSKAHKIGLRFSEDIDIAIMQTDNLTDSKLKSLIRSTEKSLSDDLIEVHNSFTSKGSRYRKVFYSYPSITSSQDPTIISGQLLFEINSFANPCPNYKVYINSFIYDYLNKIMRKDVIEEYGLQPFEINVLDKRTTLTEKLVSLIRFSLGEYPVVELEAKIRHFYDLHYLLQDCTCREFINGKEFKNSFEKLINHDRELFDYPYGWNEKRLSTSPLLDNFSEIWKKLRKRYEEELPGLSFSLSVPEAETIGESMKIIFQKIMEP